MTQAINRWRTARRRYLCDSRAAVYPLPCPRFIEAGERYVVSTLPPWAEIGNGRWWRMRLCSECAMHHSIDLDCRPLEDDPHGAVA